MQSKGMQALLMEAQKKQRAYDKGIAEIEETEYEMEKNGIVKVVMKGNGEIVSVNINKEAMTADDQEFVQESIKNAINSIIKAVERDVEVIRKATIGQTNNMGF